ncbi:MAG: fibronectin type III domain-containing protein, partial [Lachnospiraceae bacterium]|nr:fibronectin type III domain-containing protein [Lachnospiraceae bacterium]
MKPFHYAVTDTAITLYWEKPKERIDGRRDCYRIYTDGKLSGSTGKTHFTIEKLRPDTEYAIAVYRTGEASKELASTGGQYYSYTHLTLPTI